MVNMLTSGIEVRDAERGSRRTGTTATTATIEVYGGGVNAREYDARS